MQFLAAMLTLVVEMGYRVMLFPSDEQQIREVAQDHAVDGIIFLDEYVADPRIAHLLDLEVPAIGLWKDHLDSVLCSAIEELALHLESRGHQHVVCLCGPQNKLFVEKFQQIVADTLQKHAIATTVLYCPPHSEAEVALAIAHEMKQEHVTAVVASSDKLAIHALHGLHAARLRVPDDCAIVGFGDVPSAQWVQPPLTTIRVPVKAMAQWAVAHVLQNDETDNQPPPLPQNTLVGRLVVRRSC
jgi:DNA-binding LacI/PurR family transcriptional regulator